MHFLFTKTGRYFGAKPKIIIFINKYPYLGIVKCLCHVVDDSYYSSSIRPENFKTLISHWVIFSSSNLWLFLISFNSSNKSLIKNKKYSPVKQTFICKNGLVIFKGLCNRSKLFSLYTTDMWWDANLINSNVISWINVE